LRRRNYRFSNWFSLAFQCFLGHRPTWTQSRMRKIDDRACPEHFGLSPKSEHHCVTQTPLISERISIKDNFRWTNPLATAPTSLPPTCEALLRAHSHSAIKSQQGFDGENPRKRFSGVATNGRIFLCRLSIFPLFVLLCCASGLAEGFGLCNPHQPQVAGAEGTGVPP